MESSSNRRSPALRWWQFSLSGLFAATTLSAVVVVVWQWLTPGPPPAIAVMDVYSTEVINRKEPINLGYARVGNPVSYTFTIQNQGEGDLRLDRKSLVLPTGFSIVGELPQRVAPSESAPFTLQFDASFPRKFSGQVCIASNDRSRNPYRFSVEGEAWNCKPVAIQDLYSTLQGSTLRVAAPGVLQNDGDADQHPLTAELITPAAHAETFAFNADGSFSYRPVSGWAGIDRFTYRVNDGYVFSDPATVRISVVDKVAPKIEVLYDEDTPVPNNAGSVDFPEATLGENRFLMFQIVNIGLADLRLDRASLRLPRGFSLGLQFDPVVQPNDYAVLTVVLDTEALGPCSGQVSFTTNDPDARTFSFTVRGTVVPPRPSMEVYDGAYERIANRGRVDLGETTLGTPLRYTFTITNTGRADLTLDATALRPPAGYRLVGSFASQIEPFQSTELTLQLEATVAGDYAGEVSLANNDRDASPFNFRITGRVLARESAPADAPDDDGSAKQ